LCTSVRNRPRSVGDGSAVSAAAQKADPVIAYATSGIAKRTGVPANQASFHLRQLAKYGLVEVAPDAGRDNRDRVWRLVDEDPASDGP
jgi:predicted ArsR family transcriptional regulator